MDTETLQHIPQGAALGVAPAANTYFQHLETAADATRLQHLITGYWVSQAIAVAADLGIADLLADGPRSSAALAEASGADAGALYRLLRALASVGIFTETVPRTFSLTPMGELLRADAPGSLRNFALYLCSDVHWRTWSQFGHSVRTGESAFEKLHGMGPWEYRSQYPETAARFDAAMTSLVLQVAQAVTEAYDFSRMQTIIDVGGGAGTLLVRVLQENPHLRAKLLDLPHVAAKAREHLLAAGLQARCDVLGGDMFTGVPEGGDVYVLSRVIHDWDDAQAVAILRNCRRVMQPRSRVLLVEEVLLPGDAPSFGKLSDLNMLVSPGGQERTEDEYRTLFRDAGLSLTRIISTRTRISIVEGGLG